MELKKYFPVIIFFLFFLVIISVFSYIDFKKSNSILDESLDNAVAHLEGCIVEYTMLKENDTTIERKQQLYQILANSTLKQDIINEVKGGKR